MIYANGSVNVGAWGSDVAMTRDVAGVRQNLVPLVAGGRPTARAASPDWRAWGATCGATSCAATVPGIEHQWRSGVGVTASGALVYAPGRPWIRSSWPGFWCGPGSSAACSSTSTRTGRSSSATLPGPRAARRTLNGSKLVPSTVQGPWTFFQPWWARDFITLSARPGG